MLIDGVFYFKDIFMDHRSYHPQLGQQCCIAKQSVLYGHIILGDYCSVWPYAVLRGDVNSIKIGNFVNIQEHCVLHVSHDAELVLEDEITVGHGAILHGCYIEPHCLVGMRSTILDGAHIGHHCIIGANTLITQNKTIPPYSLVLGSPGKVVRALNQSDLDLIQQSNQCYKDLLSAFPF